MNLRENIKIALSSVRNNLLRAVLTMFIIAFGIMALVGILTAIDTAIFSLNDNFNSMGANTFSVRPKRDGPRGNRGGRRSQIAEPINFDQALDFKERYRFPATVSVSGRGTSIATASYGDKKTSQDVSLIGVDAEYFTVRGYELKMGRFLSQTEVDNGVHRAVVGQEIVKLLFDNKPEKALDKVVSVGNIKYKIIGVLESKGSNMNNSSDRVVLVPLLNIKRYYGSQKKNYDISVAVNNAEDMDAAEAVTIGVMRNVRRLKIGEENDFEISKSDGLISFLKDNTTQLRGAAVGIGLITLLGAAIGLMNIMLVSVTERTREIGICKALGATRRNILLQFLTEAVVICQLGGILGILLGIMIGNIVTWLLGGNFLIPLELDYVGRVCLFNSWIGFWSVSGS